MAGVLGLIDLKLSARFLVVRLPTFFSLSLHCEAENQCPNFIINFTISDKLSPGEVTPLLPQWSHAECAEIYLVYILQGINQ